MALEKSQQNIIVLASQFNPSIFREYWLEDHEIFSAAELAGNIVYTPMFCQVSGDASFVVVNDRIQFITAVPDGARIGERAVNIVTVLPETPYSAVGLNFMWSFTPDGRTVADVSAEMFRSRASDLFPDTTVFGVAAQGISGPAKVNTTVTPGLDKFEIKFNYHFELSADNATDDALAALNSWGDKAAEAEALVHRIFD